MKFKVTCLIIVFYNNYSLFSQWIDNDLRYINSKPLIYWETKPIFQRDNKFWSKYYSKELSFPIISVDAALMLKVDENCERFLPRNDFVHIECDCNESGLKLVPEKTYYFHLSHSMSDQIKSGEFKRFVAFRIDSLPRLGEVATFEFLLLNQLKDMELEYVLDVYFSEELVLDKLLRIKNKIYSFGQLINEPAEIGHGFEIGKKSLLIDDKSIKYKWIIIVDPVRIYSKGYILPRHLSLNGNFQYKILEENQSNHQISYFAQFDLNSYLINMKEKDSLTLVLNKLDIKKVKKITLKGQADNSGDITQNVILAFQRSQTIKDFLISFGIEEKIIFIDKPRYDNVPNNKFSRGCQIEINLEN